MKQSILTLFAMTIIFSGRAQERVEPLVDVSLRLETYNAINQAVAFLLDQQLEDGSFSKHPGITAMATYTLLESPENGNDAVKKAVDKARTYMLSKINDEGAISLSDVRQDVYSTSTCLMTLSRINNPADKDAISRLRKWLIKHQYQTIGGFAYGGPSAPTQTYPDLSNTHWALEALTLTPGKEMEREYTALKHKLANFMTTCQVIDEKAGSAKGGFLYYPIDKQPAKKVYANLDKVWGSLTMGALKSLLFSGVKPTDPRIVNGLEWTRANYTMTSNPGWDQGGWFYYTYMFSSAMVFLEQDHITVPDGKTYNWRSDLLNELLSRQKNGDHWENTRSKMWMEGDPNLCTAYALKAAYLALKETK